MGDSQAQADGTGLSAENIAVRSFLDRLMYVRQWYEVARSHAHAAATRDARLEFIRQAAQEQDRLEALDAAAACARAAPILDTEIGEPDLHHVREAIVEAATALAVRDLIEPEQFWRLYRPFAALIPVALPLDWGSGNIPIPSR